MTVSTTQSRIGYNGNGATTVFAFPYRFLANTDLVVTLVRADTTQVVQTLNTDYTVMGAGDDAGGTVTMVVAPATGQQLIIVRAVPLTQETDYISGDPFPAETHERALDKLTMISQRLESLISRSIRLNDADLLVSSTILPSPIANATLVWNATGTAIVNGVGSSEFVGLSPYMEVVLGSVDAAEALTNLQAAADAAVVKLTGAQTIADIKTFSSSPVVPTATTSGQAANKGQMDTAISTAVSTAVVPSTLAPTLFVEGTAQGTASGTARNFTGIPSWAREVTVLLKAVSTNGTSRLLVQVGGTSSGTYLTSGYTCLTSGTLPAGVQGTAAYTDGASLFNASAAAGAWDARLVFSRVSSASGNWVFSGVAGLSSNSGLYHIVGGIQVTGSLDKIRITTAGGVDVFDAGQANIFYG
jgi:hypothetical protein